MQFYNMLRSHIFLERLKEDKYHRHSLLINKISKELLQGKSAIFSQLLRKLQNIYFLLRWPPAWEPDDRFHSEFP